MPGSKRFLHPEAIKRISRLEIRARHIVEGFLSGMHRSPYFGQSVEFLQHREYVTGDDLRHVDWKVWARQDRLYVKQFEEETNLRCHLLVDISQQHGLRQRAAEQIRIRLHAGLLAGLPDPAAAGRRRLHRRSTSGSASACPSARKHNHIFSIVDSLAVQEPRDKTDMYAILRQVAEAAPRRGLMVLVSDLLADRPGLFKGCRLLRQRGHDVLVFHVMDDEELDFPFNGPTRFEGLEIARLLELQPAGAPRGLPRRAASVSRRSPPRVRPHQLRLRPRPHRRAARRGAGDVPKQATSGNESVLESQLINGH